MIQEEWPRPKGFPQIRGCQMALLCPGPGCGTSTRLGIISVLAMQGFSGKAMFVARWYPAMHLLGSLASELKPGLSTAKAYRCDELQRPSSTERQCVCVRDPTRKEIVLTSPTTSRMSADFQLQNIGDRKLRCQIGKRSMGSEEGSETDVAVLRNPHCTSAARSSPRR